jgi:leucyl aminopeptidase
VHVQATTDPPLATDADTIAVGLFEDVDSSSRLPAELFGDLVRSTETSRELGRVAVLHGGKRRLIVAGLGPRESFGAEQARVAAATVHNRAAEISAGTLCWEVPRATGEATDEATDAAAGEATDAAAGEAILAGLIEGTLLHAYRFDRYKSPASGAQVQRLLLSGADDLGAAARAARVIVEAQNRARDLGNTPANDLPPHAMAEYAQNLAASQSHLSCTIIDGEGIREAGMGAFAAVAQGSEEDARLIRLDYEPPSARGPHLGLVGKGITFDSGGLSLKRASDMHEMKFDMCGGAAVIEAMAALSELEVPARVTAVVGATENLPSGRAVKPGDIVRALDGTTIEINNTDAEGRLVLADCLCHARQQGCERLVDIATLTGGVVTALGYTYAGLMSNDKQWGDQVRECGERTGERVWPLPLDEQYAQMVQGAYAQLTNRAERREAQPITAAELLHHFAGDVPWAHLDIAGTAWDVPRPYYVGKGATGFGVRLLVDVARSLA